MFAFEWVPPIHGSVAGWAWTGQPRHSLPIDAQGAPATRDAPSKALCLNKQPNPFVVSVISVPEVFKYSPGWNESALIEVPGKRGYIRYPRFTGEKPRFGNLMEVVCEVSGHAIFWRTNHLCFFFEWHTVLPALLFHLHSLKWKRISSYKTSQLSLGPDIWCLEDWGHVTLLFVVSDPVQQRACLGIHLKQVELKHRAWS